MENEKYNVLKTYFGADIYPLETVVEFETLHPIIGDEENKQIKNEVKPHR